MTKPTITVELTLHPDARDGQQNAWKVEMRAANGEPLLVQTATTATEGLMFARQYLLSGVAPRFWLNEPTA